MSIEDFYWSFTFKQIVLVNSGKYCYVKVPLNEHICLLGANNGGKTSILNSLKFFLLPEENLHDCAKNVRVEKLDGLLQSRVHVPVLLPWPKLICDP